MTTKGSARTASVAGLKVAGFGRGAAKVFALPISFDKMGIKKAAVLPEPF